MRAYIVVGPTNANPAFLSALDRATDSGEVVGTSAVVRGAGAGSGRKDQMNASSPPRSRSATVARALVIAACRNDVEREFLQAKRAAL